MQSQLHLQGFGRAKPVVVVAVGQQGHTMDIGSGLAAERSGLPNAPRMANRCWLELSCLPASRQLLVCCMWARSSVISEDVHV